MAIKKFRYFASIYMGRGKEAGGKESMKVKAGLSLLWLVAGGGCIDRAQATGGTGTRIWNLSDRPVELQVRVGSILKKVHTLKPGLSKRLEGKSIYQVYMPGGGGCRGNNGSRRSTLYYYDESCRPYVWIHDTGGDFTRVVKQQYLGLEDLRDCSEIWILRDSLRDCICVQKKPRSDFC